MTRKRNTEPDIVVSSPGSSAVPSRRKAAKARNKHVAAPVEGAEVPAVVEAVETTPAATVVYSPTHDEIAAQAYLYWEARGYQGGSAEEDWLRAERELQQRAFTATA